TSAQHTSPAGFWVRTIATGFDFIGLSLIFAIIGALLTLGADDYDVPMSAFTFPLLAVYLTITTARWGTTAGKALVELEVVSVRTGHRPSWGQAAKRAIALCALPTLGEWLGTALQAAHLPGAVVCKIITIASFPVFLLALLVAAIRTPGKRAPWDRLA